MQVERGGDHDDASSGSDVRQDSSLENLSQDNRRGCVGSLTGDEESDGDHFASSHHLNAKRARENKTRREDPEAMSLNSSTASSSAPSEPSNNPAPRKTARPSSPNESAAGDDHEESSIGNGGADGDTGLGSQMDHEEDLEDGPDENDKAMFRRLHTLVNRVPANIAAVPPPAGDTNEINRALVKARDIVPSGSSAHTVAETAIALLHGQTDSDAMVALNFGPGGVHQRTNEYLNQIDRHE